MMEKSKIEVTLKKRVFKHNGIDLADPDCKMSEQEVIDFYSSVYPELVTGHVKDINDNDDTTIYNIATNVGTKG